MPRRALRLSFGREIARHFSNVNHSQHRLSVRSPTQGPVPVRARSEGILQGMSGKIIALWAGLSIGGKYAVMFLLMAVQSACIPIPSEVIMPLAGAALAHTQWDLVV